VSERFWYSSSSLEIPSPSISSSYSSLIPSSSISVPLSSMPSLSLSTSAKSLIPSPSLSLPLSMFPSPSTSASASLLIPSLSVSLLVVELDVSELTCSLMSWDSISLIKF